MKTNQNKNRKTESKNGSENDIVIHKTDTNSDIVLLQSVFFYQPVGRALTRSSLDYIDFVTRSSISTLERKVCGSSLGPVKSDAVLPTACQRCDISSKGAVLPGRNDAEMGPANSLHVST